MHDSADFPLSANLPCPVDDGASDHLPGLAVPRVLLPSTFGGLVDLSRLRAPRIVVYCYPMSGVPGKPLPKGWDDIPGVRDSIPQASNFQDRYGEFLRLGVDIFGLSTEASERQREVARRMNLPYEILSDAELKFCGELRLPTFQVNGTSFLKQLTLVIRGSRIEHALYPVFPPDQSAEQVMQWLYDHPLS
jgi:peroxiredoxin